MGTDTLRNRACISDFWNIPRTPVAQIPHLRGFHPTLRYRVRRVPEWENPW